MVIENRLLIQDDTARPLGQLTLAGILFHSQGIGRHQMRTLGSYAIVLQAGGAGYYRDVQGHHQNIMPGDCLLVFPDVAHAYGPHPGGFWNEIFVCFDGPIFDQWRREELLSSANPVYYLQNWQFIFERLSHFLEAPRPLAARDHLRQLNEFLAILAEMVALPDAQDASSWHLRAQSRLGANLGDEISLEAVARDVGMSYETFRKRFAAQVGVSPARFRDQARIKAAQTLIREGALKNQAIARSLGFRDEAHLARRFRELTGQSPREWKQESKMKTANATDSFK